MKKYYYKSLVAAAIITSLSQTATADELTPVEVFQDTWTNETSAGISTNYGSASVLRIDTPKMHAFVQFNVADIPAGHVVDTAILTLTANSNKTGNIPDTFIAPVEIASWDAATLTSENDDALIDAIGEPIASATDIAVGSEVIFDLSSAITANGTYTFLIDIADKDARNTKYDSGDTARGPKLTITTKLGAGEPEPTGDTTKPVFPSEIEDIVINATTATTDITSNLDIISGSFDITATDDTDGVIAATIVGVQGETGLLSGKHTVELQATDAAGNKATGYVTVKIKPYIILTPPETTLLPAGATATATIALSGPAIGYPATIDYTVNGDAATADSGTLSFEDAASAIKPQNIDITLLNTAKSGQTAVLTLTETIKVQASSETVTITPFDGNTKPTVSLSLTQAEDTIATIKGDNADEIPYIDATKGDVTVTLNVTDFNLEDTHAVDWTDTNSALIAQTTEKSFTFSPEELSGDFAISVVATETNTSDKYSSNTLSAKVRIIATTLPELVADADSDGDGILDTVEGFKDSDGDGIVDYLDHVASTVTQLPLAAEQKPLQTKDGLTLSLGSIASAKGIGADSAVISLQDLADNVADGSKETTDPGFAPIEGMSIVNFTINGLANDGDLASVVYPLPEGVIISDDTEYRKYTPQSGWATFVSDADNRISSAEKNDAGNCPAPNDPLYSEGLIAGNSCIQLTIKDGGIYDADGLENSSIEDPGVLSQPYELIEWSKDTLSLGTHKVNENVSVVLTKHLSALLGKADISTLTFTVDSDTNWLSIDEEAILTADLSKLATDDYTATISFSDDQAQTGTLTIDAGVLYNNAPELAPVNLPAAARNEDYSASISELITDPESDSYTISKVSGPYWLNVSETGELSGMPHKADLGENTIELQLVDSKGASKNTTFNVDVVDNGTRDSDAGSFSATLFTLLGLLTLRRRKHK